MKLNTTRLYSPSFAVFLFVISFFYSIGYMTESAYTSYDDGLIYAEQDNIQFIYDLDGGVLWDDENIKITSWGIEEEPYNIGLSIDLQNKTDKEIAVQIRGLSVNGWSIGTYFSCDVPAGRTTTDLIVFEENDMAMAGIEEISHIMLQFYFFNWDNYSQNYTSDILTIGNYYDYSGKYEAFDGITLYDGSGVKIVLPEIDYSPSDGPMIPLYIENNTDETLIINLRAFEINGIEVESYYSCDMLPHTVYIGYINYFENYTELYGIEECKELTFDFEIMSLDFSMHINPPAVTVTVD